MVDTARRPRYAYAEVRYKSDPDEILAHLEQASRTLSRLRGYQASAGAQTMAWRGAVPDPALAYGYNPSLIPRTRAPSSTEIDHMDTVLDWLNLIPDDRLTLRRVLGMRLIWNAVRERPIHSWRSIGLQLRCSPQAASLWFIKALEVIAKRIDVNDRIMDRFKVLQITPKHDSD